MIIEIREGLPFVTVTLIHGGISIFIPDVVLDTGSVSTLFRIQDMREIGLEVNEHGPSCRFRGIGGTENIFMTRVDRISIPPLEARNLEIGLGEVRYGFGIRGILGMDFFLQAGAVIDLAAMELGAGSI
jgi:predicted aspartyl protease